MEIEQVKAWLDKQAKNYYLCLEAVRENIDSGVFDYRIDGKTIHLSVTDLKDIASNLYIQANKAGLFRREGDPNPPRNDQDEPITDPQLDFIEKLKKEVGQEYDDILDQHLRLAGVKVVIALTKDEGTNLITALKTEKNKRRQKK